MTNLDYPCPRCGAKPGEVCRTASGREVRSGCDSHEPRWETYYAASTILRQCVRLEEQGVDVSALRAALEELS